MILTVTLNTALDITYHVGALRPGEVHRVDSAHERAGGKGVNVARVLHELGEQTVATGLVGGATGATIRALLDTDHVRHSFVDVRGPSRRTIVVVDGSRATGLWEPGAEVDAAGWEAFVAHYTGLLRVARVAVLSGSLPPGVPVDGYARLIALARAQAVPVILDASGDALAAGLAAGPDIVKPNAHELATLAGEPAAEATLAGDPERAVDAADELRDERRTAVVVSLGPHGLVAATQDARWYAKPAGRLDGNPTGAGDAVAAALARGIVHRTPWPGRLADAIGLSGAAVLSPVAGTVNAQDYRRLRRAAEIREMV